MGAESKEHLLPQHQHDLESGAASSSSRGGFCLPPLALLRRKKLLVLLLILPAVYFFLYSSPFDASDTRTRVMDALHAASPAINDLAGKLPSIGHHYDDAHLDSDGHLHNALLDTLHVEGTPELTALKNKLEANGQSAKAAGSSADLALQVDAMTKFTPKDESTLLLLLALQDKKYTVEDDWKGVFFDRTPLDSSLFSSLNSGPTNKFTQLLAQVGLPPKPNSTLPIGQVKEEKFSILNDAHQLYSLSRADWVARVRASLGLTVFSKSYCPFSKKAKALLNSMNATYTVYEVDLRPDAHNLQVLLAELTGHKTFPNILVRDRELGGSDDLADLQRIGALHSILQSVGAM